MNRQPQRPQPQQQQRRRPPPPPPPPSTTSKYLITLPNLNNGSKGSSSSKLKLGITFQPICVEGSDAGVGVGVGVGIGARVQSIDKSDNSDGSMASFTSSSTLARQFDWANRHGMRVGDVLYRVDGKMVKNVKFDEILTMLDGNDDHDDDGGGGGGDDRSGRGVQALIFERCDSDSQRKEQNIHNDGCGPGEARVSVSEAEMEHSGPQQYDTRHQIQMHQTQPISKSDSVPQPISASAPPPPPLPSLRELELSTDSTAEEHLLSSIFTRNTQTNSRPQYSVKVTNRGHHQNMRDLRAIPEGNGHEYEHENDYDSSSRSSSSSTASSHKFDYSSDDIETQEEEPHHDHEEERADVLEQQCHHEYNHDFIGSPTTPKPVEANLEQQQQQRQRRRYQDQQQQQQMPIPGTVYNVLGNGNEMNDFSQLASPTFSYSVTTTNTQTHAAEYDFEYPWEQSGDRDGDGNGNGNGHENGHENNRTYDEYTHQPAVVTAKGIGAEEEDDGLLSPLGAGIPTHLSASASTSHSFNNNKCSSASVSSSSGTSGFEDQVKHLKQKYTHATTRTRTRRTDTAPLTSSYLSPESEYRQELTLTASSLQVGMEHIPAMDSCSVSTVFMSPQSGPAEMHLPTLQPRPQQAKTLSMATSYNDRTPRNNRSVLGGRSRSNGNYENGNDISTPATKKSQTSTSVASYYRDIPITMLDYNYVRHCDCLKEMDRIVGALKASSPIEFPSLLRLAEARLKELKAQDKENGVNIRSGRDQSAIDHLNIHDNMNISHERGKARKIDGYGGLGGVPSHIHVEIPVQTHTMNDTDMEDNFHENYYNNATSNDHNVRLVDEEKKEQNEKGGERDTEDMNEIIMAHAKLKEEMESMLRSRSEIQSKLTRQVNNLEVQLRNVKSEMEKQTRESNFKIRVLTEAKGEAEREMNELRMTCITFTDTEKITQKLRSKEEEIGNLASQLYKERESKRTAVHDANVVQAKLQGQVDSLTRQLKAQEEKTEAVRGLVETELRLEFGAKLEENKATIAELESRLRTIIDDSQVLYEENNMIANEFSRIGIRFENRSQFQEALAEFAAAEACANALAKALTESESELSTIVQENKIYKERTAKLVEDNVTLGHENKKLSAQIIAFDQELKSSNALVDRLYKDLDKYQTKQQDYERVIKKCKNAAEIYRKKMDGLRSQLAGVNSMVPLSEYQKAVGSVKSLTRCLKAKEDEINRLSQRIQNLEAIVGDNDFRDKTSAAYKSDVNLESQAAQEESKSSSPALLSISATDNSPKLSPSSTMTPRQATLRALGGRAALKEKMMKARRYQTNGKGPVINRVALKPLQGNTVLTNNINLPSFASVHGKENYQ